MTEHGARSRAVVFDLDGVLIDSEPVWREVEAEVAGELGFAYSDALADRLHGRGFAAVAGILGELTGDPETGREASRTMIDRMVERAVRGAVPAMPGARELVDALRGRANMAVASNSPRRYVEGTLEGAALGGFDAIVSAEDVERPKPAPDVYLAAVEKLGVDPGAAVAVEDSAVGVESARRAGMRVVAIAGVGGDPGIPMVGSLADLSVARLLDTDSSG